MGFFGDENLHLDECFSKQQKKKVLRLFCHFLKKNKFTKSKPRSLVVARIFKIFYNPSKKKNPNPIYWLLGKKYNSIGFTI